MGRGAKKAEDGRQALEHTRAVRMTAQNVGEGDIKNAQDGQTLNWVRTG